MSQIKFYLFGPPRLERDGKPVEINLRKALALLVYLAVTRQAHSRDALATFFWPAKDQQGARANLRRTLYDLGQLVGDQFLQVEPETVCLNAGASIWLDIEQFQAVLSESLPPDPPAEAVAEGALSALAAAVELYTGDFLAGFTLPDCPEFDDWQFFQREDLRQSLASALQQLVLGYEALGKIDEALRYARRWLALDPLEEKVHRRLMQLYALAGQPGAALRQYDECVRTLDAELGVPPEPETTALYEAIRTRRFPAPEHQRDPRRHLSPQAPAPAPAGPVRQESREVDDPTAGAKPLPNNLPAQPAPFAAHRQETTRALHRLQDQSEEQRGAVPNNLMLPATPFVGRVHELNEILRSLHTPACRLLTIVGPGGIGKSRLALQVAQRLVEGERQGADTPSPSSETATPSRAWYADGVYFVPLQAVSTAGGLISAIAEATGFHFYSDTPPRQQLVNFLRKKQMLLVLDSMEHVPEGETLISDLLAEAPGLKLLVTSQRSLNLYEEWFHPLAGMALPRPATQDSRLIAAHGEGIGEGDADSVQFFVQCARRARADFSLDAEWDHVVRICRLVGGTPLALELAAAWLKALSCKQIADEIERSLDILTARHQNIPARHRSMHAVLEQSWQQLLEEGERAVLRRLSLFRGGFTHEAAQEVAGASLLTLAALVEKAMVWVTPSGRYQMHELLRQFAHKQLAADAHEEQAARASHSTHYLHFLSTRAPLLTGKTQRAVFDEIGQDIENVRSAWEWAAQQQRMDALEPAVEPLYHFYQTQGRYQEGKEIFTQTWASLQPASGAGEISASGVAPDAAVAPVRVLARCGAFCHLLCEYEEAGHYLQASLAQAKALGLRREVAFTLNFLGQLAVWQGEQAQAKAYLLESLAISRELGDKGGAASALEKLANLTHATFGEYAESKELAAQSLSLSRELGRPDWVAYALDTLGYITFCLGEYDEAEDYYRESLSLFEAIDDQYGIAMALGGIGLVLWAMGKNAEAITPFQKSLLICRTIGHQGQVAGRLAGLARIANDLGDYEQARQLAQEGLSIARDLGSPVYLSHLLYCLGESAYGIGDLPAARAYLLEALHVTSETGLLAYLAIALYHYAVLLIKESEGEPAEAAPKPAKALELLALVQRHPATWHVYKERAMRRYRALESQLPDEAVATANASAESDTLEEVVAVLSSGDMEAMSTEPPVSPPKVGPTIAPTVAPGLANE